MSEEPAKPSAVVPSLIAALVCDVACKDPVTAKVNLIGIFNKLWAQRFPTARPMSLYFKIADAQGFYKVSVAFVQLETGKVVLEASGEASITDRLESADSFISFPPVPFSAPGRYEFQIFANGVFIGGAVIDVALSQPTAKG